MELIEACCGDEFKQKITSILVDDEVDVSAQTFGHDDQKWKQIFQDTSGHNDQKCLMTNIRVLGVNLK